jgi:hypothetical protein
MESRDHARLGPSAAHRWIHCPASVRVAESLEIEGADTGSVYAAEGTAAHTIAEIVASHHFGMITDDMYTAALATWRGSNAGAEWLGDQTVQEVQDEMIIHAVTYVEALQAERNRHIGPVQMHAELKVYPGVEGVWGTGDWVMIGTDMVTIVDYKYGTGVRVDAPDNEQLMFYGLGALMADLIGLVKTVRMVIVQPRLDHVSEYEIPAVQLLKWRDEIAEPAAALAVTDDAPFGPSDTACRFCPARGQCKAQMQFVVQRDFGTDDLDLMGGDDYAKALKILPLVRAWAAAVEEKALERVYSKGEEIPGWKTVLSGGIRKIPDELAAIEKLVAAGYDRDKIVRPPEVKIRTLGDLEKVVRVGKKVVLEQVLGDLLKKPEGKPALVPESDGRPSVVALDIAVRDFAEPLED